MYNFTGKLKNLKLPSLSGLKLCFDLGTCSARIAIKDKGIVLREANCIGRNNRMNEFIFFGHEAKRIIGKVPKFIQIIKPMTGGIIADFDAQTALASKFIEKSISPYAANYRFIKPHIEILTAVPSTATEIERRAVEEVFSKIGASRIHVIEKVLAAALGCGFNIFAHKPILIIEMGGGLIEIAIISGGGIVTHKALKNAGDHMNKLIYNYVYLKHGLILGETTCEDLKVNLLNFRDEEKTMIVRGKSLETGLPKSAKIKTTDVHEALLSNFNQILDAIKEVIELSPPEVVDEIYTQGIMITGGLANIPGIDIFFTQELKIEVHTTPIPENAVIAGLLKLIKEKTQLQMLKINLS